MAVFKVFQRLFSIYTCAADDGAPAPLLTGLARLGADGGRWGDQSPTAGAEIEPERRSGGNRGGVGHPTAA